MRMELDMRPCEPITLHIANSVTAAEFSVDWLFSSIKYRNNRILYTHLSCTRRSGI